MLALNIHVIYSNKILQGHGKEKRRGEVSCVLALISNCNNYVKIRFVSPSQPPSKPIASHAHYMMSLFATMICNLENS